MVVSGHGTSLPPPASPAAPPRGAPDPHTLARWICYSYRFFSGKEFHVNAPNVETLWNDKDALICFSLKTLPIFTFANHARLYMLETTPLSLQDLTLENIFNENGKKMLFAELLRTMKQGYCCLQSAICMSSMRRPVSYEKAEAWEVLNDEDYVHYICLKFIKWSFV